VPGVVRAHAVVIAGLVCSGVLVVGTVGTAAAKAPRVSVRRVTLTLVDSSRPTPPNGSYPGAASRTLETVVSIPKGGGVHGPFPLIVYATGYGGTATNYAPLYDHWVRAGYVVAAPTFPLSSDHAPGGTSGADIGSQPGDLRFVLDQVLKMNGERGSKLHVLVDPKRVGLVGKSLGGITVLTVGYNPAERDPRFKAIAAMTAITTRGVDFTGITTPLLLVHGDADTTVPIGGSQDAYARATAPKFFVTVRGATHGSAFEGKSDSASVLVETSVVDFLDRYVKGTTSALARLQRAGAAATRNGVGSLQATP
jgi:predicted dienelactone hydrolase